MIKHCFVIAALALLSACATQPEPCTAEWVDWKTDRFYDAFAREHRKDIDDLRAITLNLSSSGDRPDLTTAAVAGAKALVLAGAFLSDTVPEIKSAISQCGTAPKATQLFASLLRREGFDDKAVKAIEDAGAILDRES